MNADQLKRFDGFVYYEPNTGCWLHSGSGANGYAQFCLNGKKDFAHRVAYRHFKGEIPSGFHIDHMCKVKCCVNPEHLEAVTPRENTIRGPVGDKETCPGAIRERQKTHCKQGHPYSGENLHILPNGWRVCRTCSRENMRRYRGTDPEKYHVQSKGV